MQNTVLIIREVYLYFIFCIYINIYSPVSSVLCFSYTSLLNYITSNGHGAERLSYRLCTHLLRLIVPINERCFRVGGTTNEKTKGGKPESLRNSFDLQVSSWQRV